MTTDTELREVADDLVANGLTADENLIELLDAAKSVMCEAAGPGVFVDVTPLQEAVLLAWLTVHDAEVLDRAERAEAEVERLRGTRHNILTALCEREMFDAADVVRELAADRPLAGEAGC